MSFTDIKTKNQGFTIVELLIVVVVIAILAAITIVSYNGITAKANASSAKSTASSVQKKVELYNADQGRYPYQTSELTAADKSWTIPSTMFGSAAPTASNGKTYVQVMACLSSGTTPTASNVTGIVVTWWDYEKSSSQETDLVIGTGCGGTTYALV